MDRPNVTKIELGRRPADAGEGIGFENLLNLTDKVQARFDRAGLKADDSYTVTVTAFEGIMSVCVFSDNSRSDDPVAAFGMDVDDFDTPRGEFARVSSSAVPEGAASLRAGEYGGLLRTLETKFADNGITFSGQYKDKALMMMIAALRESVSPASEFLGGEPEPDDLAIA